MRIMDLLTDSREEPVGDLGPDVELSRAARVRVLLAAALGPLVTGYAAVATVLTLVTLTAERTVFSGTGVLLAAGPGWLAAHQVRLDLGGHPIGVLPLLPTLGALALAARTAAGAATRLGCRSPREALPVFGTIASAHALFGLAVALGAQGSPVTADPLVAFAVPGLLAALAAGAGIVWCCGLPEVVAERVDPLAVRGVRAGALGLAVLVACGGVVFTVATALSWRTVADMYEPGFGSSFGMFLLSVLYLPNAVAATLSFVTGPGFSIGDLTVGMFGYRGGAVPGVPLLGGLPEHHAAWWPALLVLPAATGALVGWSLRKVDADPAQRIRAVAVAGAVVALGCVLLGTLSGGRLGDGPFDPVSVPVGVASVVAFCWIVIPGSFVAFFTGEHEPPAPPEALEDNEAFEDADEVDAEEAAEAVEELEASEASEEDEEAEETEEPGEDTEFDADADAELGLEDVPAEDEAVTGGTETCGDVEPDETDR
ncbi:cell division protein PerM [Amycolatopsis kentuckyensis]|uniref:cell division protein PerM n=1 Tax=Amycolatopsis kentuckyensis TaxID=218823 RepID=UPI0035624034